MSCRVVNGYSVILQYVPCFRVSLVSHSTRKAWWIGVGALGGSSMGSLGRQQNQCRYQGSTIQFITPSLAFTSFLWGRNQRGGLANGEVQMHRSARIAFPNLVVKELVSKTAFWVRFYGWYILGRKIEHLYISAKLINLPGCPRLSRATTQSTSRGRWD